MKHTIDLHMHTTASDGEEQPEVLAQKIVASGVELFSITDHNHALAYKEFDYTKYPLICGTEIATSIDGEVVEILGYEVNPDIINDWYSDFFSPANLEKFESTLFDRLKHCALKLGLQYDYQLKLPKIEKGISKKTFYHHLLDNNPQLAKRFPTYKSFFRTGLSVPESDFFIDEASLYPTWQEVNELIHQAGGKSFLAHPYEYRLTDKTGYLSVAQNLDGVECFHPSASQRNSLSLVDFCQQAGLSASAGSDYHRKARRLSPGVRLLEELLAEAPFAWLHEYF